MFMRFLVEQPVNTFKKIAQLLGELIKLCSISFVQTQSLDMHSLCRIL
jgi:hypothetical protein